jgi:glucosamine-6-phosphate deaminase
MNWQELDSPEALSAAAAELMLATIREHPTAVLGLPTGRTPLGMYARVIAECSTEYHCFSGATTFNLDEYVGLSREHPASYFSYMKQHLFDHVDIDPSRVHIPDGSAVDPDAECARYEAAIEAAGGLDLTFLGLGRNGHIGFNEPGTPFDSRTRVVTLADSTRSANADFFPDGRVPTQAITMGIGTILSSKRIVLLASGRGKEQAIDRLHQAFIDRDFPASALWTHKNVTVLVSRG